MMEDLVQRLELDPEMITTIYTFILVNAAAILGMILSFLKGLKSNVSKKTVDAIVEEKVNKALSERLTRIETGYEKTSASVIQMQTSLGIETTQKLEDIETLKKQEIELQKTQFEELIASAELE